MTEFNPFGGSNVKLGVEEFLDAPEASYAIFKNGIFKRSKESTGVFTIKVQEPPPYDLGLTKTCSVSYQRNEDIPKIPYGVFYSIFKFYKGVFNTIKSEVYSMVFWDKEKKDFFIHIPKQKVSFASVSYEKDPELFGNPNLIPYFESH